MQETLQSSSDLQPTPGERGRRAKVAFFVSHPIQYQAPLLCRISREPDIDLKVFFSSDLSVRSYHDSGFGVQVKWDVPLLDGYSYEFLPRIGEGDALGFAKPLNRGIFRRLRAGRFDAIWVFGYNRLASLQAMVAAKLLRVPVLIQTDSSAFDRNRPVTIRATKWFFFRLLRPLIAGAISIGHGNAAYWRRHLGQDCPLFQLPYAVDNDYFRQRIGMAASNRDRFREELELHPGRPIILYASKLLLRKRCSDLVEAFLRISGPPASSSQPYLLIAGDGEDRARLERRVRDSGCSDVRFLGFRNQSELPMFFDLCDIFVLPSDAEPWGLIVNEVMNAGKPVIVTDRVGCYPDLVRNGVNGFVYPCMDVDALTECLRCLLNNPDLRQSMGQESLRIIQQYSFEQDVAGLRRALQHLVPGFEA